MSKKELVSVLSEKAGFYRYEVDSMVDALAAAITESLLSGERIAIPGVGVFSVKSRPARVGRNPRTGEAIEIPEKRLVVFSMSKKLKQSLTCD